MVLDAPVLTIDDAIAWALRLFGVTATGSRLPSERDQNVLLHMRTSVLGKSTSGRIEREWNDREARVEKARFRP
jgi:hypothetical protein